MIEFPGLATFQSVFARSDRDHHFPTYSDLRFHDGGLFPSIYPRFKLNGGERVFAIGSCFVRNIEPLLLQNGLDVPTAQFTLPEGEFGFPAPHLLNEYNAGTIFQRIAATLGGYEPDEMAGVEKMRGRYVDMFVHHLSDPVTLSRLGERRREISALYRQMLTADCVMMTLGMVEAWYDKKYKCYVNRTPSYASVKAEPERFCFRCLDPDDIIENLEKIIVGLHDRGVKKILITVSPVPLHFSFLPGEVIANNFYSKAALRVSAQLLCRKYPYVDYYPSYEIVNSFGFAHGYKKDLTHVQDDIIRMATEHMIAHYVTPAVPG